MSEETQRLYSVVMKEKDSEGKLMSIEADELLYTTPYGEGKVVLMAIVDDGAFYIPIENVCWTEQHAHVKEDAEVGRKMAMEKMRGRTSEVSYT